MASPKLADYQIKMGTEDFRLLLAEILANFGHSLSRLENLLEQPLEALKFTEYARERLVKAGEESARDLPDQVLLHSLTLARKNHRKAV